MNLALIWFLYFIPIPRFVLWIGKWVKDAFFDCIFAQSFSWLKFAFGGEMITSDANCLKIVKDLRSRCSLEIQVFSILKAYGFDPGPSNHEIARVCLEKSGGTKPIIAQWEVAMSIWQQSSEEYFSEMVRVVWPDPKDDYLTTRVVKKRSIHIMHNMDRSHPLEIAHHGMWARAILIVRKLGAEPVACIVRIPWTGEASGQWWTRNVFLWLVKEPLVRLHHLLKRYVI